jgi:hypothetical protein
MEVWEIDPMWILLLCVLCFWWGFFFRSALGPCGQTYEVDDHEE